LLASCALVAGPLGETQATAEPSQPLLLVTREHAHLAHEPGHVAGEDVGDEAPPRVGQRHGLVAAVVLAARALDEPAPQEIDHHDGGVGVAAEELLAQLALTEGPMVEQGLERAELPDGEPGPPHHVPDPNRQRLGGAHELDVRVEGRRLRGASGVACRHGSNSNRL
jgi:hypothetical protein